MSRIKNRFFIACLSVALAIALFTGVFAVMGWGSLLQKVGSAAATIHAGATVADSLPHGSFFHATGGSVFMSVGERLKLIPYEAAVGLASTVVSCLCALV